MHNLLFGIFPYIAITIMLVGSIARYERDPFTWKTKSSQLLRKRQFVIGSVLFHVGILAIFAGHVVGLLTPSFVWHLLGVSYGAKQIIAIVAGGLAGLATLAGGAILLHRRLSDPRIRANSSFGDNAVMAILVAQVTLGLATIPLALGHLDGSEMVKFMAWAQGTLTFQAGAAAGAVHAAGTSGFGPCCPDPVCVRPQRLSDRALAPWGKRSACWGGPNGECCQTA